MISKTDFILQSKHGRPFDGDIRYVADNQPKPIVLFIHGFKGFKDALHFNALADRFAENGLAFAKINLSHNGTHPDSPEEFVDLTAFSDNNFEIELDDVEVVLDFIQSDDFPIPKEEIDTNQIYLIGHSRGGGIAIIKACEDDRVKKLVTWSAVTDFEKFWGEEVLKEWKKVETYYVNNLRTGQQMPLKYQIVENYQENIDRFRIAKRVKGLKSPFLAIHGDSDETVPVESLKVLTKANSKISFHIVEGAGHTFGGKYPWDEDELPEETEDLLKVSISFLKS